MALAGTSGLKVFVPFKYDLGGTIVDTERLMSILQTLHGEVTVDTALLRTWNLSYLARRAPVVSCALSSGEALLGGVAWSFTRRMCVYPWLGVVSVDYTFATDAENVDLAGFYDDLVDWKNRDYLPYLEARGALSQSLRLHVPSAGIDTRGDLHGVAVAALGEAVSEIVERRPFRYDFHDFRLCFVGDADLLPEEGIQQLLWLSGGDEAIPEIEQPASLRLRDLEVVSTGWSTVVRSNGQALGPDADAVLTLLSLIHAQWYVCQLWISAHDLRTREGAEGWKLADAHILSANQSALVHDLSEIDNLIVILKDPGALRVARYLETAMRVRHHKETAVSRLHTLEHHSRQLADHTSEMELRRFQTLFAISAAAGIASLVPALAQVGFTEIHVVTTVIPFLGFWILFAVDVSVMREKWRARRRRR